MEPKQALQMIDGALSTLNLTRVDHQKLQAATMLLGQVVDACTKLAQENSELKAAAATMGLSEAPKTNGGGQLTPS